MACAEYYVPRAEGEHGKVGAVGCRCWAPCTFAYPAALWKCSWPVDGRRSHADTRPDCCAIVYKYYSLFASLAPQDIVLSFSFFPFSLTRVADYHTPITQSHPSSLRPYKAVSLSGKTTLLDILLISIHTYINPHTASVTIITPSPLQCRIGLYLWQRTRVRAQPPSNGYVCSRRALDPRPSLPCPWDGPLAVCLGLTFRKPMTFEDPAMACSARPQSIKNTAFPRVFFARLGLDR